MQYPKEETIKVIYSELPLFATASGATHILATPGRVSESWLHVILALANSPSDATDFLGWMLACSTKHVHVARFATHGEQCELFIFNVKAKHLFEGYIQSSQDWERLHRVARAMKIPNPEARTMDEIKQEIKARF